MHKRVFFFHYNKPASKTAKSPKLSVHFKGVCYIVDHIKCHAFVESKHNKRQPHCVMRGKCFNIHMSEDRRVATIL